MNFSVSIPIFKAYIRNEYLFNLESGFGEFTPVVVFGLTSLNGRAVGFHVMTNGGAQISRIPINALVHKKEASSVPLDWLQLWDCFSYNVQTVSYDYLKEMKCKVLLKDRKHYEGEYMFTIDWVGGDYAEEATEYKCGHVIKLDNGCFAIQPNNRIYWLGDPSFITKPLESNPQYLVNSYNWKCENNSKWFTEDNDNYFYNVENSLENNKDKV
jgi:hypothetical protein